MPSVAEIKSAVQKLSVKHRADLLEHLAQDEAVQKERLARLRADIAVGERDLAEGRYTEIRNSTELRVFFDDIKRQGRARLKRSA